MNRIILFFFALYYTLGFTSLRAQEHQLEYPKNFIVKHPPSDEPQSNSQEEVRNYLTAKNILEIVKLPKRNEEREEFKKKLLELYHNGLIDYLVFAIHYAGDSNYKTKLNELLIKYEQFVETVRQELKQEESQLTFSEKEKYVLQNNNTLPKAQEYLQNLETEDTSLYQKAIELSFKSLFYGQRIFKEYFQGKILSYDKFDCDEMSVILQKLISEFRIGYNSYIASNKHVSLRLNSFPLVIDSHDMRIRSLVEFATKAEYKSKEVGSYFLRDHENHYLGVYEEGAYPKKIKGYTQEVNRPYRVSKDEMLLGLILDLANQQKLISVQIDLYEFILELNPDYLFAHHNYANLLFKNGKNVDAKKHYERALMINSYYADTYYNYAILFSSESNFQTARQYFEIALSIDPNNAEAHYSYANLLNKLDKKEEAQKHYEYALEIDPQNANAHNNYAVFMNSQGNRVAARVHYQMAWMNNPNHAEAFYNYANFLLKEEDFKEARLYYTIALEINPHFVEAHYSYAASLYKEGKIEEAKVHYKKVLELNPLYEDVLYSYAFLLQKLGDKKGAQEYYEKAIEKNPNDAPSHNNLAVLLNQVRDKERAHMHFKKALEIDPTNVEYIGNYAVSLEGFGNQAEAGEYFREALRLDANNTVINYQYAQHLFELKNYEDARKHLDKYRELLHNHSDNNFRELDEQLKNKGF